MSQKVRIIPPNPKGERAASTQSVARKRVAGYARVSTDEEEQKSSYEAQVDYYSGYIRSHPDWEFVGVYTDEGISGTSTRYREGFQRMVQDAFEGKIDLIVTKSVSRFARNTVDSLTTIRELKEHGTEVYFEKENIRTFDSKGELLLTIMSSLAQEESRSISENVKWGTRKKFSDGRYSLNYKHFLGYDRGPGGTLVINAEQAAVVRRIYGLYLTGRTPSTIAKLLTADSVPTPAGKTRWYPTTVDSILCNETYMGDKLLQKTFSVDFLSKTRRKNQGEVPQYYVEGDHEAIIPPETFQRLQEERERRKSLPRTGGSSFSGKLWCGACGRVYGSKVLHSNDKYRRIVWRCNGKYEGAQKCDTPTLTEDKIKASFERLLRTLSGDLAEVLGNLRSLIPLLPAFPPEEEKTQLTPVPDARSGGNSEQRAPDTAPVHQQQSDEGRFGAETHPEEAQNAALWQHGAIDPSAAQRRVLIRNWIDALETEPEPYTEDVWCTIVDRVTVLPDRLVFTLTSGTEVEVQQ